MYSLKYNLIVSEQCLRGGIGTRCPKNSYNYYPKEWVQTAQPIVYTVYHEKMNRLRKLYLARRHRSNSSQDYLKFFSKYDSYIRCIMNALDLLCAQVKRWYIRMDTLSLLYKFKKNVNPTPSQKIHLDYTPQHPHESLRNALKRLKQRLKQTNLDFTSAWQFMNNRKQFKLYFAQLIQNHLPRIHQLYKAVIKEISKSMSDDNSDGGGGNTKNPNKRKPTSQKTKQKRRQLVAQ